MQDRRMAHGLSWERLERGKKMPRKVAEVPVSNITEYPDRFLMCRAMLHAWDNDGFPWLERVDGSNVVYERLKCLRCPMKRTDQRTLMGRLIRRSYNPPAGYRLSLQTRSKEPIMRERIVRFRNANHLTNG